MNKLYNYSILGFLVILTLNSCSVVKCRYSNGWNIGLGRVVEHPENKLRTSKRNIQNESRLTQDSLLNSTFATSCNSNSLVSTLESKSFFSSASKSLHEARYSGQQVEKDSNKYTKKNKRKSKTRRRYQSSVYDFIPDNEYEYILLIFLIAIILAIALVWAIYILIRAIVRAIRNSKDISPNTATISPKNKDTLTAKDASEKHINADMEYDYSEDSIFDHTQEMEENTEEDIEEDNKSKLLNFIGVVVMTLGLVALMALGMQNQ